jgi:uncharacterized damage-inducible protein DinB
MVTRLQQQAEELTSSLQHLPPEKQEFAYAPGKWTLKELFGHMVDTERIMAYRALCIARGEKQSLPGFEENDYVAHAAFAERELSSLLQEYRLQRQSNIFLFKSFSPAVLQRTGLANNHPATVRGLITVIAAHELHHMQILKDRYLLV